MAIAVQVGKIDQKLDDQREKLDAIHHSLKEDIAHVEHSLGDRIDKVETQTTQTNGRVRKGEMRHAELRGIFIAFGVASPFLVAVTAYLLTRLFG